MTQDPATRWPALARALVRLRPRTPRGVADVALALLVAAIVATMVVPLPVPVLDVLLALNLSLGVVLLLVAVYVPEALAIASFPTLLLLSTLYRLALDVAATRLILGRADAGAVIRAFGGFIVRGNYVVGAVVFAILTLVQYLVIARGGERVAEVAARFALDALPGRQMAIDAEQRAGGLDAAEARRRRRALVRESQFYGAMDGAMRFVKGDAVAGVVVAAVNVVGGLAIGVGQRGMPVTAALERYGLLAIGQGLVAQIPALLTATAAGVLVTRVASEDPTRSLAADIGAQIVGQPRSLAVAAALVLALALVPGLPAAPFLLVAAALGLVARAAVRGDAAPAPGAPRRHQALEPVCVALGAAHAGRLEEHALRASLEAVRAALHDDLGVHLPAAVLRADPALAPPDAVELRLHEVPAKHLRVAAGEDLPAIVARELGETLRRHAASFLGVQETQDLLDDLATTHPALLRSVVPKPLALPVLADVLRRLVDEGVGVRNLRAVLEALAGAAGEERDPAVLAERARAALRREITHRHASRGRLTAWLLAPEIEDAVRDGARHGRGSAALALDPDLAEDVLAGARAAFGEDGAAVVLTRPDVRRFVRALLAPDFPRVAVLSHDDLDPAVRVDTAGRVDPGGASRVSIPGA